MKKFFKFSFFIALALGVWTILIEPYMLIVREVDVGVHRWPKDFEKLKIVVVADFHFDRIFYADTSRDRIINKINEQKPDIVLMLGDYITSRPLNQYKKTISYVSESLAQFVVDFWKPYEYEKVTEGFLKIKARYGIYAILGNHDYKLGPHKMKAALKAANITVLENSNAKIDINGKSLFIAGIADFNTAQVRFRNALSDISENDTYIFLTHTPEPFDIIGFYPSLTLAGHTHGGQVAMPKFLRAFLMKHFDFKYMQGLYESRGRKIFVTSGLGTSGPPMRFLCPPEIIVLRPHQVSEKDPSN